MEPFLIELACVPADKNSEYEYFHITGIAISDTQDQAILMVIDNVMARSMIVENVLRANPTALLPHHEQIQLKAFAHRASLCEPPCAVTARADLKQPDDDVYHLVKLPDKKTYSQ